MNRGEITRMLLLAKCTDDRVTVDEQRVQMWWLSLDRDIPADFAPHAVADHYAKSTVPILPAHVNILWDTERSRRSETERSKEVKAALIEAELQSVDPREYIRRIRQELLERHHGAQTDGT